MSKINVGIILKPQGVKGEVKVKVYTSDLDHFLHYGEFIIEDKTFLVETSRTDGSFVFLKFKGLDGREFAESFRNKEIFVKEDQLEELDNGEFYIYLAEKCKLKFKEEETPFGEMIKIHQGRGRDVFEGETYSGKKIMFPHIKDVVLDVDTENFVITLNKKRFYEVTVFED